MKGAWLAVEPGEDAVVFDLDDDLGRFLSLRAPVVVRTPFGAFEASHIRVFGTDALMLFPSAAAEDHYDPCEIGLSDVHRWMIPTEDRIAAARRALGMRVNEGERHGR